MSYTVGIRIGTCIKIKPQYLRWLFALSLAGIRFFENESTIDLFDTSADSKSRSKSQKDRCRVSSQISALSRSLKI